MPPRDIKTIIATLEELKVKQVLSDELSELITKIQESTDTDGLVEIEIKRIDRVLKFPATLIENFLTSKKGEIETERDTIVDKITIRNGK